MLARLRKKKDKLMKGTGMKKAKVPDIREPSSDKGVTVPIPRELRNVDTQGSVYIARAPSMDQGPYGTCGTFASILALSDAYVNRTPNIGDKDHPYDWEDTLNPYTSVTLVNQDSCETTDGISMSQIYDVVNTGANSQALSKLLGIRESSVVQYKKPVKADTTLIKGKSTIMNASVLKTHAGYAVDRERVSLPVYLGNLENNFRAIRKALGNGHGITARMSVGHGVSLSGSVDRQSDNLGGSGHLVSIFGASGDDVHIRNSWRFGNDVFSTSWYRNFGNVMGTLREISYVATEDNDVEVAPTDCLDGSTDISILTRIIELIKDMLME